MSKNQFLGVLSWIVAPASLVDANVPLRAASRLNGRVEEPRVANGGSTRVNGADVRRLLLIPAVLRFGDRPAGAVKGARIEDVLARSGVTSRDGMVGGGGIDFDVVILKVKGLTGLSNTSLLVFFEGELKMAGSTFSPSKSSKLESSNTRLFELDTLFSGDMAVLPPRADLVVDKPSHVSTAHITVDSGALAHHSDGFSHWRDAEDVGCPTVRTAL